MRNELLLLSLQEKLTELENLACQLVVHNYHREHHEIAFAGDQALRYAAKIHKTLQWAAKEIAADKEDEHGGHDESHGSVPAGRHFYAGDGIAGVKERAVRSGNCETAQRE